MKLGIVLPSWIYSAERRKLADATFASLMQTEPLEKDTRLLLLVKVGHTKEYVDYVHALTKNFSVILKAEDEQTCKGTEQTLAFGTSWLFKATDVEYITWMGDDALFHPMWLWKLESLIKRRPAARSWSVYRSAYEWIHRTLQETDEDVLVRSICGHGLTFSRNEWEAWGIDWRTVHAGGPDELTLDLMHYEARVGERWVTKQSWIQHTGKEGVHCSKDIPEFARDFQMV